MQHLWDRDSRAAGQCLFGPIGDLEEAISSLRFDLLAQEPPEGPPALLLVLPARHQIQNTVGVIRQSLVLRQRGQDWAPPTVAQSARRVGVLRWE